MCIDAEMALLFDKLELVPFDVSIWNDQFVAGLRSAAVYVWLTLEYQVEKADHLRLHELVYDDALTEDSVPHCEVLVFVGHSLPPRIDLREHRLHYFRQCVDLSVLLREPCQIFLFHLLALLQLQQTLDFDQHRVLVVFGVARIAQPLQQSVQQRNGQFFVLNGRRFHEIQQRFTIVIRELPMFTFV